MAGNRILVVDDETEMLVSCRKILQTEKYRVATAETGKRALTLLDSNEFDLVICDLKLTDIDGLTVLEESKRISPDSLFVFITAYGTIDIAVEAMKAGAFTFLEKPFTFEKLIKVVEQALTYREGRLFREEQPDSQQTSQFENIVGRSPQIQRIFDIIVKVATSDSNVMISGESGTGKELVALSIHNQSLRKTMPFVPVNCGALPEHLFESELFGHEKGAFTGAHSRKIGLLEFANGGTFFLDEVCALSPASQVKLLRIAQDKKIRRVGGDKLIDVDIRFISATNVDPDKALSDCILREDLYYRLKVITINLPPLRERIEDIPLLCDFFLKKYLKLNPRKRVKGFTSESILLLQSYSWPGNVRELQNVIESALALSTGHWITPGDLPDNINNRNKIMTPLFQKPLKDAKSRLITSFEREYLANALVNHEWNISTTAKHCGIDRRTLQRLMRKYHINKAT
jgi:two-component system response regulator AtoC